MLFCCLLIFPPNQLFSKISFRKTIRVLNSLGPNQATVDNLMVFPKHTFEKISANDKKEYKIAQHLKGKYAR